MYIKQTINLIVAYIRRNLKVCIIILFAILISTSVSAFQKKSGSSPQAVHQIVEAENMNLSNYQIDSSGSSTYIKLTGPKGIAKFNFTLPTGNYDIDARYLSESVGENLYVLYIANKQIVSWEGKNEDNKWHMLSEQKWQPLHNILINKGDEIKIEGVANNGSSAIFEYIKFTSSSPQEEFITIYPKEYENAIKNPLKGFRLTMPSGENFSQLKHYNKYATLIKDYFKWNELENSASDGVNKIKNVCNVRWRGIEKKNIKIIPRVYLDWPGQKSGWPADMKTGDFTSNQFKKRVIAFIKKLGQAWDNDPRVAYVEMGIIGQWGEMEFPDTKKEIKEAMAAQFNKSFKNKLVMIRWPNTYNDHLYNFGYFWDSFAHYDQKYYGNLLNNTAPRWKTAVIGGEVAYNWGQWKIQPGKSPDESLKDPIHRNYIIDRIRKLHANHLGWIADYDQSNDSVRAGAEIMQKALGYRFVITEVTYPKRIDSDTYFTVSFKVKNTGSSPFYYKWPVEVSLLDPGSKQVVWKRQCPNIDIRKWMPGDQWDDSTHSYLIPAEIYTASQTFLLPGGISPGAYILALAILDPAGDRPCVRFAINNYYNGGRQPIGKVGINQTIDSFSISGFDDIQSDTSLSYDIGK